MTSAMGNPIDIGTITNLYNPIWNFKEWKNLRGDLDD